jgi:hypothetical protein
VGDFLAYQFMSDINYSTLTDFSEMEFTVPGPGTRDGIHKCFESIGELSPSDVIRMMADIQEQQFARLGLRFSLTVGTTAAAGGLPESVLRGWEVRTMCTSRHEWTRGPHQNQTEVSH